MSPFDLVLIIVGAMLTLVGVYLFATGKMTDKASKVEAFGIKLDVTNPSLILILAGVGLMLAPKLLPEQLKPEPPEVEQTQAAAPAGPIQNGQVSAPTTAPETPAPTPTSTLTPTPAPTPTPMADNSNPPVPTPPIPSRSVATPASSPTKPKASPRPTTPSPQVIASKSITATPAVAVPATVAPPATVAHIAPAAPPVSKVPVYLVAAMGSPDKWKSFWENEEAAAYSQKVARRGAERLRRIGGDEKVETLTDRAGVSSLMSNNAMRQERCKADGLAALAVFTVAPPQVVISRVESAYWPELTLVIHDCQDSTARREVRQLAPRNTDRFPFESDLVDNLDRIFRDRLQPSL